MYRQMGAAVVSNWLIAAVPVVLHLIYTCHQLLMHVYASLLKLQGDAHFECAEAFSQHKRHWGAIRVWDCF